MIDRGTVRNVQFYSKNKFEKLVHLVCFIMMMHGYLNVKNEVHYGATVE